MLRIEQVSKRYGAVVAVDTVSLDIQHGEFCTLLGPSGCGKTTLLRIIAGLERQTHGKIFLQNIDVSHQPPFARAIGMVFQSYALFPHLTVQENIAYGLQVLKRRKETVAKAVGDVAQLLRIHELLRRHINQLSGGQQQRVALARALVMKPQVLLFDEPLSNLDAKLRRGIREEIRGLQQQLGITAVYVTHDQSEALAISDRVVVMDHGRIIQQGSPHALYNAPVNAFVAQFIGEANLVPVQVVLHHEGRMQIQLGDATWEQASAVKQPGTYQALFRPEQVRLRREGPGIRLTVQKATFVGAAMEYLLHAPWGTLFVIDSMSSGAPFQVGEGVFFDPSALTPALVQNGPTKASECTNTRNQAA